MSRGLGDVYKRQLCRTDAATKIASVRQSFASTDVYLEMIGFDQADIRRIKAQEQRARGQQVLTEEFYEDLNE